MNDECDPGDHSLILAEEGPTMDDTDTFSCWECPGPDIDHAWNPTGCYSNGGRVYWSPHFKIDYKLCCGTEDAS